MRDRFEKVGEMMMSSHTQDELNLGVLAHALAPTILGLMAPFWLSRARSEG